MLSYIAASLQHQLVILGEKPNIRYTTAKLLHNDNGVLRHMHILHKCMNRPDLLEVLVKDPKFRLVNLISTLSSKCIYAILQVYQIPENLVGSILTEMLAHSKINDDIFTLISQYYCNMPKLPPYQVVQFGLYRHFPQVPVFRTDIYELERLAVSDCKAFLYLYPKTSTSLEISSYIALNADIMVLKLILSNGGEGYPIAYWRVYNKFPPLTEINSLTVAYYIRKHDPKYYWSLNLNINVTYAGTILFDMNEDVEIVVDLLSRCSKRQVKHIVKEHKDTNAEHWISVLASNYITNKHSKQINIDTCTACKYILERI